jgi:hypothetical protein
MEYPNTRMLSHTVRLSLNKYVLKSLSFTEITRVTTSPYYSQGSQVEWFN